MVCGDVLAATSCWQLALAWRDQLGLLAAALYTNALSRDARCHLVFQQSLADGMERPTLKGKEEIGTRIVGELEVQLVVCDALSLEPKRCDTILTFAIGI